MCLKKGRKRKRKRGRDGGGSVWRREVERENERGVGGIQRKDEKR